MLISSQNMLITIQKIRPPYSIILAILLLISAVPLQASTNDSTPKFIATTDWLQSNLDNQKVVIIDARPLKRYIKGHIDGSINLPVDKTFSLKEPTYLVGSQRHIEELFSSHGISNDKTVVIYDDGEYKNAARIFWILNLYGHDDALLLDGGWPYWEKNKLPTSLKSRIPEKAEFKGWIRAHRMASLSHVKLATKSPHLTIIDTRAADEFTGKVSKGARNGHIPTAISLPSEKDLRHVDGINLLPSKEFLQGKYSPVISGYKPVITYCNYGHEGSLSYFNLRRIGANVAVYDGSWLEWSAEQKLPIDNPSDSPASVR